MSSNSIKKLESEDIERMFHDEHLALLGNTNIATIDFLNGKIGETEKSVLGRIRLNPEYAKLQTIPGFGKILSLTIMLETGPISRFLNVRDYTSYCRCVEADKTSNKKKKGHNNSKNGSRYLAWAYLPAAGRRGRR